MSLFTRPIERVSRTRMFARLIADRPVRQVLVFSVELSAKEDLAVVLPLCTPKDSAPEAVRLVDLDEYTEFFKDMQSGFPPRATDSDQPDGEGVAASKVSFVPKASELADSGLSDALIKQLPCKPDYGFAVIELRGGADQAIHPVAFTFPTRNHQQLFFPTTFMQGAYESRAQFDHDLYFQGTEDLRLPMAFDMGTGRLLRLAGAVFGVGGGTQVPGSSTSKAEDFMKKHSPERGLVDGERKVHRFTLRGKMPNRDVSLWPKYHPEAGNYP